MEAVPILEVENLSVSFHTAEGKMNAVRNVSFSIGKVNLLALSVKVAVAKRHRFVNHGLDPSPPGKIESGRVPSW